MGVRVKMGKSKRRILHNGSNNLMMNLKREDALIYVVKACCAKNICLDARNLLSLFGFSAEELLEAGASYEDVKGLINLPEMR